MSSAKVEKTVQVKKYRVTNRLLSWCGEDGVEVHAHEGQIVTDVPEAALVWYLAEGHMEPVEKKKEAGDADPK